MYLSHYPCLLGEGAVLKLEPLSLSPVVRSHLCLLAGKKNSRATESKLFNKLWRLEVFNSSKLVRFWICPAASPQDDTCQIPPHLSPCKLIANLLSQSHFRGAGRLGRLKMIITFRCPLSSCGSYCSKAGEFCRLATSDL